MAMVGLKFDLSGWSRGLSRAGKMAEAVLSSGTARAVERATATAVAGFAEGWARGMNYTPFEGIGRRIGEAVNRGAEAAVKLGGVAEEAKRRIDGELAAMPGPKLPGWVVGMGAAAMAAMAVVGQNVSVALGGIGGRLTGLGKQLSGVLEGAAERMRSVFAGAMARMEAALGQFGEAVVREANERAPGAMEKLRAAIVAAAVAFGGLSDDGRRALGAIEKGGQGGERWMRRLALRIGSGLLKAVVAVSRATSSWTSVFLMGLRGLAKGVGFVAAGLVRVGRVARRTIVAVGRIGGRVLGGMRSMVDRVFNGIFTVGAAIGGVLVKRSLDEFLRLEDAATRLRAAVASVGPVLSRTFDAERFEGVAGALSGLVGITRSESMETMGDFLTRGFDPEQAELFTALAASIARKTGRSMEDVQRRIADAGQGSVDALKALGVQIHATGNAVVDADAGISALFRTYGTLGDELANPFDLLRASVSELMAALGERLLPIFGPLIEKVNLFVQGLLHSEEGAAALEGVAKFVGGLTEMLLGAGSVVLRFWDLAKNAFLAGRDFVLSGVFKLVEKVSEAIAWLLRKFGQDDIADSLKTFAKDMGDTSAAFSDDTVGRFGDLRESFDAFARGEQNSAEKWIDKMMEEGRRREEENRAALEGVLGRADGRTSGFAGSVAREREAERGASAAQEAVQAREANNRRVAGMAEAGAGAQVSVRIMSTRPDRFRRMRMA